MDCRFSSFSNATLLDDNHHLTTEYSKCDWWNQHDTYTTDIFQLSATHTQTLTPTTHGTPIHNELGYMEFWNNNHNYHSKTTNSSPYASESQKTKELEPNELQEVLKHVPALPRPSQRRQEKKVKFIMIATSLDKTTILKKLGEALSKETCRTIPLSFKKEANDNKQGISENGIGKESETVVEKPKEVINGQNKEHLECSKLKTIHNLKRKQTRVTQKEHFTKEGNDNNQGVSEDGIRKESGTVVKKSKETVNGHDKERLEYGKQNSINNLKRKQNRIAQKEYWKHGCSRNIVTVQMSCEATKSETAIYMKDGSTNEFEEESSELERQIKMLNTSELLQA